MSNFSKWFSANKVLIFGLLSSIALTVQQFFANGQTFQLPAMVLAVGIAATGFLAKNLRGQWVTIAGAVGSTLGTISLAVQNHSAIGWPLVISGLLVNILSAVAPAGKSLAYEQSPTIEAAKAQAKNIDTAKVPPVNPPVETATPQPNSKP